jgi:hypothetical protein
VVAGSVAGLPAVSLAEVVERSALQARIEHKYLVPLERFAELAARLSDTHAVLEIDQLRGFAYESVYFDTPDLLTYRQHLQGRRRRYKARLPYPVADRTHINPQAQAFLADQLREAYGQPAPQLAAKVTIAYRRTTLVDLQRGTRLTCDVDLTCTGDGKVAVGLSRHVLVETKRHGRHGDADIGLRSLGLRPREMSKYCVAVALLHPGIHRNPGIAPCSAISPMPPGARRAATPTQVLPVLRRSDLQGRGRGTAAGRR